MRWRYWPGGRGRGAGGGGAGRGGFAIGQLQAGLSQPASAVSNTMDHAMSSRHSSLNARGAFAATKIE